MATRKTEGTYSARVVVHIGLHKTGTRFLQRGILAQLDPSVFLVNPEPLFSRLRDAVRHPDDDTRSNRARKAAEELQGRGENRNLVLSDPSISGDMYDGHAGYRANMELIYELFPRARVVFFVRSHADWLQSAYRQSLKKGRGQSIEQFLNCYGGEFCNRGHGNPGGTRTVEALAYGFDDIYRAYADRFGPENVYLFRQEDLKSRWSELEPRLAEALGLSALPAVPRRVSGNRSFSALAIRLFVPAESQAGGSGGHPSESNYLEKIWHRARHRGRRLRSLFIQHLFDRVIYKDWDLLSRGGMRDRLEAWYERRDQRLADVAAVVLARGPGRAAREAADRDEAH